MSGNLYRLPIMIVALVIGIIMVTAVILPLSSEYSEAKTFTNDGYFHMNKYDDSSEDITIFWDHEEPTKITVNDSTYTLDTPVNVFVSVAIGDDWYFRYANGVSNFYTQMSNGGVTNIAASTTAGTDLEVVCSEGTATGTVYNGENVSSTQTATYTELYVISGDSGDYVMKDKDKAAIMAADTEFLGLGTTSHNGGSAVCKVTGNIDDGATVTVIGSNPAGATIKTGSIKINDSAINGYIGYDLTSIQFTLDTSGTETDATYSYFIVPYEVDLDPDNPAAYKSLVMVIPLMAFVVLVVAAAAMIYYKKD